MNIEYDVMELPSWEGTEKADVYNTAVVAMAEATKYPEETYRFMKFCLFSDDIHLEIKVWFFINRQNK